MYFMKMFMHFLRKINNMFILFLKLQFDPVLKLFLDSWDSVVSTTILFGQYCLEADDILKIFIQIQSFTYVQSYQF